LITVSFFSLLPAPANAVDYCGVGGNIVTNCGFETGDLTGWTRFGDTGYTGVAPPYTGPTAHGGVHTYQAGPMTPPSDPGLGGMSQDLATQPGTTYDMQLFLFGGGASTYFDVQADLDGAGGDAPVTLAARTDPTYDGTWHAITGEFTATSTTTTLVLHYYNESSFWYLDDISVVAQTGSGDYDTSVTDIADPDSYTCPVSGSTMIGVEDRAEYDVLDGLQISGVTFGAGDDWFVWSPIENWVAAGNHYVVPRTGSGTLTFAAPVADASLLASIGETPVFLEAYSAADVLLATAGPAEVTYPTTHMRELRVTSQSADIAYVVVHDSANYFAVDDICYAGLTAADVATSTGLVSSANPSVFGQSVDLTATVTPDSGSTVPTGTVEFWDDTPTKLGEDTLNGSGVATLTVSDFAVGTHNLTAKYVPGTGFTASESDVLAQVVDKAGTTTTIDSVTPSSPSYGQTLSFDTTVAPVAPGDGTPTGAVTYKVNKFAGTPDATGYVSFDPATDLLPAGTHHVEAYYAGDDNFTGSQSNAFVVTVDQAETTVSYLGDYLAIAGNDFTFKANVDSPVGSCETGRAVTFKLLDGATVVQSFTATSGAGGAVTKTVSTTGWTLGAFDVLVEVAESSDGNCAAADNEAAMDVITVASPGDAATGGGWYFWKDSGAGKRVNFGFTVSKQADNSYKGSLLLMNQGVWRIKANLDSFTRTDAQGQAGGTGTLYQWVLADPGDPTSGSWQNPRPVSLKITFTDEAAGKAKGRKGTVVDQFALTNISVKGATLPVSGLKGLRGGNIVLR
jgi:hypothetical protein